MVHERECRRGRDEHQRDLRQGGRCGDQRRVQQEHHRRGLEGRSEGQGPADGEWSQERYVIRCEKMGRD